MGTIRSPRNNLSVLQLKYQSVDYAECVDTLYEVADAELNSDKTVHDEWHRLAAAHKQFTKSFIRFIKPKVIRILQRDDLHILEREINIVCERIYEDWEKQHGSTNER